MQKSALDYLKAEYQKGMSRADGPMHDLKWEDKLQYGNWLAQMYHFLCHATRLLCASGARLTIENDKIHMRMIDHCQQEKTHERMALNDLRALGLKYTDFPQFPPTAQLYQSQYYLINYVDPTALFGCILYLEGLSLNSGKEAYKRSKSAFGDGATLFLRTHTQEDEDHIDQAFAVLAECNETQLKSILWSFQQCDFNYLEMLNAILKYNAQATIKSAA